VADAASRACRRFASAGDDVYNAIFHPYYERLLAHCDAVLRIGGASSGTDRMVEAAERRGLLIYRDLAEIPCAAV